MKLSGSYSFNAPRALVWDMLQDPEVLAQIMPGAQKLERVAENEYEGRLKVRVGPVQGIFQGNVSLSDLVAPHSYHMSVSGKGPAGFINGEGEVRLEETDDGTVMHYDGEAQVGGRIATVGQRLMDSSARSITRQSLEALEAQVNYRQQLLQGGAATPDRATAGDGPAADGRPEEAPPPTPLRPAIDGPPPPPAPPSQTQFALNVARDVAGDLASELSQDQQKLLLAVVGFLGAVLVIRSLLNWWSDAIARRVVRRLRQAET